MTDVIIPVSSSNYYPNPNTYLGQLTSDPSSPLVGQWWYRADTGQIRMYTTNGIVTLQYESTEIVSSNTTIGGTGVNVTTRLVVLPNITLTIYGSITFMQDVVVLGTLLSSNPSASSSSTQTNSYNFMGTLYLDGTYEIAQYNTDQINNIYGGIKYVNTAGTITINGTLTPNMNLSLNYPFTINGSGALTISGHALTQGSSITISVSTINVAGAWSNAGYGITIPSGATVSWNVTGSIVTASTPGTLTVNGTCYWIGSGITASTSNAQASFTLSLAGSGIFIGAPAGQGTATATVSLSSTAIAASSSDGSATGSGKIPYYTLSSVSGSATGKYTIGTYDSTVSTYQGFVLIYIGTANTSYTVSGSFGYTSSDTSGDTINAFNMSGSAGTITLTGTCYV